MRTFQYLPYFEMCGWEVKVSPLFSDAYLRQFYNGDPRWLETALAYLRRILSLIEAKHYDLIWIEKELFPFLPAIAELLLKRSGVPYVVDYDDALFHRYDQHWLWPVRALFGQKIDTVMKHAVLVVAGNEYLAQRAEAAGAKCVEIVPTVVDLDRYSPGVAKENVETPLSVGWIGTPWTSQFLLPLKEVFKYLKDNFQVRFIAVGGKPELLKELGGETWPWTEESEVNSIRQMDIGIMPLPDKPFTRYKCGYKLIQYMACGLPVVASPVGVNNQIVEHKSNGFLADGEKEWRNSLAALLGNAEIRKKMGHTGRKKIESWYSLQVQAPRLETLLRQLI